VLQYARALADNTQADLHWVQGDSGYGGWWKASGPTLEAAIRARAVGVLEFFRRYAGADSVWAAKAETEYSSHGGNRSMESGVRGLGDLLHGWATQVEAGIIDIAGEQARAEFEVASSDLMHQVRALLDDGRTHPAAAIVLAGAALETAMRAVVIGRALTLPSRLSISAYSGILRSAGLVSVQGVKDFEQCEGLRNSAAHGEFEALSLERAGLMEQHVNLLLRRLADVN
jgi:hypothetical protein